VVVLVEGGGAVVVVLVGGAVAVTVSDLVAGVPDVPLAVSV
jgi:hypothetical protein